MEPYYEHNSITIYHADSRFVLPSVADASVDTVFADPPYAVGKAAWDSEFTTWWLADAARVARLCLAITPGVANLYRLPEQIGPMRYAWTLSIRIVNGTTRGALGFGNWIPCVLYTREGVSLYSQAQDATEIAIGREAMPNHPSPKPYPAMLWILQRLPGRTILDPFMGSGTTLRAAKVLGWDRATGIEREQTYCDEAIRWLAQEVLPLDAA